MARKRRRVKKPRKRAATRLTSTDFKRIVRRELAGIRRRRRAEPGSLPGSVLEARHWIGKPIIPGQGAQCDPVILIDGYECTLVSSQVGPSGSVLHCEYDCPDEKEPKEPTEPAPNGNGNGEPA